MKGFLKFVSIFISILLLSAVLAPLLYDFLPFKFEKIFHRLVMIFSIASVLFFVRVRRETLVRFGLDWRQDSPALFSTGFFTAFLMLLLFTGTEFLVGNAHWGLRDYTWTKWIYKIVSCFATASVIGPLEEFFFRGFVYTSLRDKLCRGKIWLSMMLTSVFYSAVHFINLRRPFISPDPGFMDSLKLIAAPVQSFADWQGVWPAAIGLFLFGMVLNYAFVRSGSLYPSIGLHAGCVLFLRTVGYFVKFEEQHKLLLSSRKVYDGVLGWIFLLLIGLILTKFLRPKTVSAGPISS
ncbi:MAG TPA: CPBP family intramembrane metalloprotease [Candidatus Omnitrophota bacterium]|nr:CPBP family intramembrane metalloprotease [Candidatus Omnitrophota bacterium]